MPIFEATTDESKKRNIIGVLQILNKKDGVFEKNDEELLASMASQIAIAINNSNLYTRLEKKVSELDLLFEIEREQSKAYTLDELLNILIDIGGNQYLAWFSQRLYSGSNIDTITKDISILKNDLSLMNTDTK